MAFWGCKVKPGKPTPFVPPPEASKLHVSQACLSTKAKPGTKAVLRVKATEDGEPLLVCVLREGGTECMGLDLIFDQYTEFSVEGGAAIHLTGYFMPEYELGGEDESDEDEGDLPGGRVLGIDEYGVPVLADEYDSEEDSDYETEESDEDEEMGSEDEDGDLNPPRRVVIEDVTELDGQKGVKKGLKALPAPEQPAANGKAAKGKGKAAEFSDDDVDASEDEEGEEGSEDESEEKGSEEGSEEESEEEGSEEEEEEPQAVAKQQQAAAAAGQKRKAEQPPSAAKQPPKKEVKQAAATPAAKQQQAAATPATKQQAAATPAAKQQQQSQQKQQQSQQKQQQQQQKEPPSTGKGKVRKFPNGFEIEDLKMGRPDGKLAKVGKRVQMRYVGRLKSNGKVFDQTKGNATFPFRLGVGEVIKGWDRGVEGMREGDKRKLTIPPQMAYGTSGVRGAIPPNAWLEFEVELVKVA